MTETATKRGPGRPRRPEDRWVDPRGYVMVRAGAVIVPEHRLVMMALLGRELRPNESVRHRDRDRSDNRPENLQLWVSEEQPARQSVDVEVALAKVAAGEWKP